jgi:hypothetical protein
MIYFFICYSYVPYYENGSRMQLASAKMLQTPALNDQLKTLLKAELLIYTRDLVLLVQ